MMIKTANQTIRDNITTTCETLGVETKTTLDTDSGLPQYRITIVDSEHNKEILSYFDSQIKEHDSLGAPTNSATVTDIEDAKTYIGTSGNGGRAFITWSLVDGKFSASGEVWNASGTDVELCGQCIDSIVAEFPESAQAQAINKVWAKWHLNDMQAGTPRQMAAIEGFKPEIERRAEVWQQVMNAHANIKATMLKRIEKAKAHERQNVDTVYGWLVKKLSNLKLESRRTTRIQYAIGRHELITSNLVAKGSGALKISLTVQDAKLILRGEKLAKIGKPKADHDTICAMLKEAGLYLDNEHMIEITAHDDITGETITRSKPYAYGSMWLTEELPAEIVAEIASWEQVPAPSEPLPIEQFIIDNDVTAKFVRNYHTPCEGGPYGRIWRDEWLVTIGSNNTTYKFTCGQDMYNAEDVPEQAIPCIMSDAQLLDSDRHGYEDPMEYLMHDLGYEEYSEAKRILTACKETAEKLGELYNANLAL